MNDLADVHAPMIHEDGTVAQPIYYPSSRNANKTFTQIPSNADERRRTAHVRRQITDFGMQPKQLNLVSLVCMYTLMGLADQDIGYAIGLDTNRVVNIKMLDAYASVYDAAVKSIIDDESDDVRHYLMANAKNAAKKLVELAEGAEFESVQFAASKDILDRSGQRPVDIVEHHHKMDGELRIVVTKNEKIEKEVEFEELF